MTIEAFNLPERLAAKARPELIGSDQDHFEKIASALEQATTETSGRLAQARQAPARGGQQALDRDQEVHRLTARLHLLDRFGLDMCLGRMVGADGTEPIYIGRLGLADATGHQLLVDWRSPAAAPFFAATRANPMGLANRRHYRWSAGRVSDYWDESFTTTDAGQVALDEESAFIASLAASRSPHMRDVLGTIAADQDAIIRRSSDGTVVVDGGPGTGKTVVALHRAAYLLYSDPRLEARRGGVLVVGPHQPYLAYVRDVLPSLGEENVKTCTLADLVPQGAAAIDDPPPVAELKASAGMVAAIEPAVALYEQPPTTITVVETPWADIQLSPADWAEAFDAAEEPHNEARDQVWEQLLAICLDKLNLADVPASQVRRSLETNRDLATMFARAWPLLEATDIVGDLWAVPAYLRRCAPHLSPEQVAMLHRPEGEAWTIGDLPLLDAARRRLGDPEASRRRRRAEATQAAEQAEMSDVIGHLIDSDDSEMQVMSMLRGQDLKNALADDAAHLTPGRDPLAGPFAHIVVDEAQELTDAQWQMLLARCPSRSFTVVGDRAQARRGFTESWQQRLQRVGLDRIELAGLSINYRTPQEVMAAAEPVIKGVLPDANVPTSIRHSGIPVHYGPRSELDSIVAEWLDTHEEGTACVIGDPELADQPRVRSLPPVLAKGLEFDLVVLVEPDSFGSGVRGTVDRYVAMTRATQQLAVLAG